MTSSYQYTPYIWPLLTGVGLFVALGICSWRHRSVPGATGLAFITLFSTIVMMASILELTAVDVPTKIFWFQIEEICLLPVVVAGLAFALGYAGLDTGINYRTITLLTIPTLFFIPLSFTNEAHHLVWTRIWVDERIHYIPGVFNYGIMSYGILLSVITLFIFIWLFIRSPLQRWPVGLILLNMIGSRTLYFLNVAGVNPVEPFEMVELASIIICLNYFVALFYFRLFNVVPVARNRATEQMRDGMLVFDAEARIADLNRAAQDLIGANRSKVIGRKASEVFAAYPDLLDLILTPAARQDEVWLGDARCYQVRISPLVGRRNFGLGKLILFSDISEQKRAQRQLKDHQRKLVSLEEREWLAQELHDGVGQTIAAAHLQIKTASELLARGQAAGAEVCLNQLAEVIREGKAYIGDYLFGVKTWSSKEPFFTSLRQYVLNYNQSAQIRTDLVIPPEVEKECLGEAIETQLQRIIQEALTNVRKHSRARSARLAFGLNDGQVQVTIEDDGHGFDPAALGDNRSFGLRAMAGRAKAVGARFEVKSTPGNGTQLIVQVPRKKGES
jgi:PAS domain S-box-containing protein